MKSVKMILTVLLCIAMICVISASEMLYCAHSTFMSPSHFTNFLDKERNLSQLTALIYSKFAPSTTTDSKQDIKKYAFNILKKLDQDWIKSQVYIGSAGLQKYIVSEAESLPTLDFEPLNTAIKATLISDVMNQPKTLENLSKVKTVLAVLNNKYFSAVIKYGLSNQLVKMLLELAPIQNTGFNGTTISEIIDVYLSFSNESTTLDQASYSIVQRLVEKELELDKLKAYFDMDLFMEKAFGSDNPVLAVKNFVKSVDASMSRLTIILFWCLILLLFINFSFSLIKFLRIVLYCICMATIFNLLLSVLLINPNFSQTLINSFSVSQNNFSDFWVKLWVFFLRDFGFYFALQSIVISFFSVLSYLIISSLFKKSINSRTLASKFTISRFTAILVVFILLFSWWNFYSINKDIKILQSNMQKLSNMDVNQSIINGIKEAGGMNFLKYFSQK
jgi:hypothetical protein